VKSLLSEMDRVQLLTGAPTKETVERTSSKFCDTFVPAFGRYLEEISSADEELEDRNGNESFELSRSPTEYATFGLPKWRAVPLKHMHKRAAKTTGELTAPPLSISQTLRIVDRGLETTQTTEFLKHSYHAYSQSELDGIDDVAESGSLETISLSTQDVSEMSIDTFSIESDIPHEFKIPAFLSSLRTLANPQNALAGQLLVKVNLMVGVISVLPTRTVTLRRNKRTMNIVEVIVGDDTGAGLSVNFWISPSGDAQNFTKVLPTIRPRDILLLQNISLSTYRGKVYGQSLNPKLSLAETLLEVIGRDGHVTGKAMGTEEGKKKLERVVNWVSHFLWRERIPDKGKSRGSKDRDDDSLPPDSCPP
jgi:hypothetical protein